MAAPHKYRPPRGRAPAAGELGEWQIGRILRASPPEAWERTGIVGDRGDRPVNQMINGAVEHLTHHLQFVIEKRRALSID